MKEAIEAQRGIPGQQRETEELSTSPMKDVAKEA